jgi:phosphoribosylaminoimidazole-succinocarboxamide synthase
MTKDQIKPHLHTILEGTEFTNLGPIYKGKVRDCYMQPEHNRRIMITTDRQSAFDFNLGHIPLKGQALNQLSIWWFNQTKEIIPNHLLNSPDPNVIVGIDTEPFKVEMVIRGFLSGSTSTSAWTAYAKGERQYCGHTLPEGLKKNDPFPTSLITPTTKSDEHDEKISKEEILTREIVSPEDWEVIERATFALFKRGQELAQKAGLILVDTKYEFGKTKDGKILLIDEIHTPDSSRFWIANTYEERRERGEEPENFDKEFLRLWYTAQCDPYNDPLPEMTDEFKIEVAKRYIDTYEKLTGTDFIPPKKEEDITTRIEQNLSEFKLS